MKKLISLFLLLSIFANSVYADCNWATDITQGPNNTHIYTNACHLTVGSLVRQAPIQAQQISDLMEAITLKDAALLTADKRTQMWMDSTSDEQERILKISSDQKTSEWVFFGLGVMTTVLAGWMASRLLHP